MGPTLSASSLGGLSMCRCHLLLLSVSGVVSSLVSSPGCVDDNEQQIVRCPSFDCQALVHLLGLVTWHCDVICVVLWCAVVVVGGGSN